MSCSGLLIINADDWGRDPDATDSAFECVDAGRVSSVSAMVFMRDSERAAALALDARMDVGLHLNLTEPFSAPGVCPTLSARHAKIRRFLRRGKYALILYNPFIARSLRDVFEAQWTEFRRLYHRDPSHVDGHQHMHLCTNMVLTPLIPEGRKVRRSFSFGPGEKSLPNRAYRRWIDRSLARRYRLTDYFFALSRNLDSTRLGRLIDLAAHASVELMTHTWNPPERDLLMSPDFGRLIQATPPRGYESL